MIFPFKKKKFNIEKNWVRLGCRVKACGLSACGTWAYGWSILSGRSLSKGFLPVFNRVSEKTTENSEMSRSTSETVDWIRHLPSTSFKGRTAKKIGKFRLNYHRIMVQPVLPNFETFFVKLPMFKKFFPERGFFPSTGGGYYCPCPRNRRTCLKEFRIYYSYQI